jgi:hypothetical protein
MGTFMNVFASVSSSFTFSEHHKERQEHNDVHGVLPVCVCVYALCQGSLCEGCI